MINPTAVISVGDMMNTKIIAIVMASIVVAAGVGVAMVVLDKDPEVVEKDKVMLRVFGNADGNSVLDSNDVKYIEGVISGKFEETFFSDANRDGVVDSKDVDIVKKMIAGEPVKAYYENYKHDICSVRMPVGDITALYYQVVEAVVLVGGFSKIKASDDGTCGARSYNFPGIKAVTNLGPLKMISPEALIATGTKCIVTGSNSYYITDYETKLDSSMDIVRLANGAGADDIEWHIVTLGFILGLNENAQKYLNWAIETKKTISDRLAKGGITEDKKVTAVCIYCDNTTKFSVLAKTSCNYESLIHAGAKNLAEGLYKSDDPKSMYYYTNAEWVYGKNPDYLIVTWGNTGYNSTQESFTTSFRNNLVGNGLDKLPGMASGKVVAITYNLMNASPYVVGTMWMAKTLYPDLFADIDIMDYFQEYCDNFTILKKNVREEGFYYTTSANL